MLIYKEWTRYACVYPEKCNRFKNAQRANIVPNIETNGWKQTRCLICDSSCSFWPLTFLSCISLAGKHAENVFGELFNEANTFYGRANSLQDRIDRLAVKVTQLDSSVEEGRIIGSHPSDFMSCSWRLADFILNIQLLCYWFVVSLQDINMRKAFKSSTHQDQQVLSKHSLPDSVAEMHSNSNRPPPLNALTAYRCSHPVKTIAEQVAHSVKSSHFMGFFFLYNSERIPQTGWNSTLIHRTFSTYGRRKCFRTQRKRGKRGGGRG